MTIKSQQQGKILDSLLHKNIVFLIFCLHLPLSWLGLSQYTKASDMGDL